MLRKRKKKLSRKQKRIKKRVTIRTLFLLSITLIFNTYAWFLYVTTVSSSITAHVEAWHVQFKVDNQIVERDFPVIIEHAYPGMTTVTKTVQILNDGEKDADIDYAIKSVRIFNTVYIATDQMETGDTIPQGATQTTSATLVSMLQNDFPFTLTITPSSNMVEADDVGSLVISFAWVYESGNDATDTGYGTSAYTFYQSNPNTDAIELIIKLIVKQHNELQPATTS